MTPNTDLAAWLVAREQGAAPTEESASDAAERICWALCERLAEIVTVDGYRALLDRAVHLASKEFSFLANPHAGAVDGGCLGALRTPLAAVAPSTRQDAIVAVLASVLGLLATFIGGDLALLIVRDVWPDAPRTLPGPLEESRR